MIVGLIAGFLAGAAVPITIGAVGARYISKHPEFIMSYVGKKIVHSIHEDLQKQ